VRYQGRKCSGGQIVLGFILFMVTAFGVKPLGAQGIISPHQRGRESHGAFWHTSPLGLMETQMRELDDIRQTFIKEADPLWRELRTLNLDLRYLMLDPNVESQTLVDRKRRISEVREKLETLLFLSQIKARSVLTRKQFDRLPRGCTFEMGTMFEADIGSDRRRQRGAPHK
jgi:hypothetical protein